MKSVFTESSEALRLALSLLYFNFKRLQGLTKQTRMLLNLQQLWTEYDDGLKELGYKNEAKKNLSTSYFSGKPFSEDDINQKDGTFRVVFSANLFNPKKTMLTTGNGIWHFSMMTVQSFMAAKFNVSYIVDFKDIAEYESQKEEAQNDFYTGLATIGYNFDRVIKHTV